MTRRSWQCAVGALEIAIGALSLVGALVGQAVAGEGVLEIDQTCATSSGCFSGDSAGFPVTLTEGRYRLTSDLVVASENESAIRVSGSDVEIDLAGFTISGPVSCTGSSGATLACTPTTGTGNGIERSTTSIVGVSVRDGAIRGMGLRAISLGEYSVVSRLQASSNRSVGIVVGASSIVRDCVLSRNGSSALISGDGSLVLRTTSSLNGGVGLSTGDGSNVRENAAHDNDGDGIQTGFGSLLVANLSAGNEGDGIQALGRSSAQRNSLRANVGFGLHTVTGLTPSAFRYDTFFENVFGSASDSVSLGANDCDGVAC
jgi:hypothetical protein